MRAPLLLALFLLAPPSPETPSGRAVAPQDSAAAGSPSDLPSRYGDPTPAEDPAAITRLEAREVRQGRGGFRLRLVRAEARLGKETRIGLLVSGLDRDDLLAIAVLPLTASPAGPTRHEIRLGSGLPLLLERRPDVPRVTASMGSGTFRFFLEDARSRTVRCALTRLVDEGDGRLLAALSELAQALPEAAGEELRPLWLLVERPSKPSGESEKLAEDDERVAKLVERLRAVLLEAQPRLAP